MHTPFQLAGRFGGFVFTQSGKRRMVVHRGTGDARLLKVPRDLRRRIIGKFGVGELIRVVGIEEREPATGELKHVVSHVLPAAEDDQAASVLPSVAATASVLAPCVIRVCGKKNCWRSGGRELWEALNRQYDLQGRPAHVTLRQTGCLDTCKQAPGLECGDRLFSRCSAREAGALVAQASGTSPAGGAGDRGVTVVCSSPR